MNYKRVYVQPEVKIVDKIDPDLSYYVWLKSRKEIIRDLDGNQFMKNAVYPKYYLPDKFYVGDELVTDIDYKKRIDKMNLQYNNFSNYVFEIQGSALFRDLLYNINNSAQWAVSNRFLFSILDDSEVYNSQHYEVSSEYAGVKEWEDQFDKYMEAIKANRKTDVNRLEMPYSITSKFWWSCNRRTLFEVLALMKYKMEFFWAIYGTKMCQAVGIPFNEITEKYLDSATCQQYFRNSSDETEGVNKIMNYYLVNSKMSLILYSQFIRQSNTSIAGLFDILVHDDMAEFVHKVFKGSTTFMITYLAHESRVKTTVSNRLCAFAMSSGNTPDSWSYFLNNFIPKDIDEEGFMKLLPCSFKDGKLCDCRFHDDIKFRNEGKEVSNCPCPIALMSMEVAERKKNEDKNLIGDMYYKTTKYLLDKENK